MLIDATDGLKSIKLFHALEKTSHIILIEKNSPFIRATIIDMIEFPVCKNGLAHVKIISLGGRASKLESLQVGFH